MNDRELIERYDQAWNDHDVDAIVSMHAPDMVFENHTAGERAQGEAVGQHIAEIFRNWPDLQFRARRLYVCEGLAVSEWTASATARTAASSNGTGSTSSRSRTGRSSARTSIPPQASLGKSASALRT